jgi:uncharacterized metal-binding protein
VVGHVKPLVPAAFAVFSIHSIPKDGCRQSGVVKTIAESLLQHDGKLVLPAYLVGYGKENYEDLKSQNKLQT